MYKIIKWQFGACRFAHASRGDTASRLRILHVRRIDSRSTRSGWDRGTVVEHTLTVYVMSINHLTMGLMDLLSIVAAGTSILPMTFHFCLLNAWAFDRDNDRKDLRELHSRLVETRNTDDNRFDRWYFHKSWLITVSRERCPITGILSATVKYCILFRVVYFSMFLLETRFYGI